MNTKGKEAAKDQTEGSLLSPAPAARATEEKQLLKLRVYVRDVWYKWFVFVCV